MNGMTKAYLIVMIAAGTVIVLCIAYYLYGVFEGRILAEKLSILLMEHNYDEFDRLAGSKQSKRYIKPFTLNFLLLNSAIIRDNKKSVLNMFNDLCKADMNQAQKSAVYSRVFYYWIANKDNKSAADVYERFAKKSNAIPDRMRYVYDVYCKKGFHYIEEIEEKLPILKEEEKYEYYALLADMYKNKGDEINSKKYSRLIEEIVNS